MEILFNRDELRRLEKAAREKDKRKLADWAMQFEDSIRREYEKAYEDEIQNAIDNFLVAIVYTLHFNEKTRLGPKKLPDFIEDLMVTVDMYRTGEYKPDEYLEELDKCHIHFEPHDWSKIYREKEGKYQKANRETIKYLEDMMSNSHQTSFNLGDIQLIIDRLEVDDENRKE